MKILAIIPARYASTRFPGKPLVIIHGKSMIQRVYEQVLKCELVNEVLVATDDVRIAREAERFNGKVMITSAHHTSGTERCAEAAASMHERFDAIINVQGDEPFIDPGQVDLLARSFRDPQLGIVTMIKKIGSNEELTNPNTVKVVTGEQGQALYFSRCTIPYLRNTDVSQWHQSGIYYKHIGLYGYRPDILQQLVKLQPGKLELAESLEQLRWLANGYRIQTLVTELDTVSIDTPEDLKRVIHPEITGDKHDGS